MMISKVHYFYATSFLKANIHLASVRSKLALNCRPQQQDNFKLLFESLYFVQNKTEVEQPSRYQISFYALPVQDLFQTKSDSDWWRTVKTFHICLVLSPPCAHRICLTIRELQKSRARGNESSSKHLHLWLGNYICFIVSESNYSYYRIKHV